MARDSERRSPFEALGVVLLDKSSPNRAGVEPDVGSAQLGGPMALPSPPTLRTSRLRRHDCSRFP